MSSQIKSNYFTYRGVNLEDYNFMLCSVGSSSDGTFVNGLSKSLTEEEGVNGLKTLISTSFDYQDFEVQIIKCLPNGNLLSFNESDMFFLNSLLFNCSGYQALEYDGLVINCIFTKSSTYMNSAEQGYLTLTIHCEPYQKSNQINETVVVTGSVAKEIILENKSNVGDFLELTEIVVELDSTATTILLENKTTGKQFYMSGLITTDKKSFTIYGENFHYIKSDIDSDINMWTSLDSVKNNFISLCYGVNRIGITTNGTGLSTITFKYQCKVQYQ